MGSRRSAYLAAGAGAAAAGALWWRRNPSPCPYSQRIWVSVPHPFITRARLREILEPGPGERILEVGPGTGYYSLPVAEWIAPSGSLELVDIQQAMLDHVMAEAARHGVDNISANCANALELPYEAGKFDAAFLVTVLGEIPDQDAALGELARVLVPGGRLVVGELLIDPHVVRFGSLRRRAEAQGLHFDLRLGGPLGYFARFIKPAASTA